jgi:hypothetical protein
MNRAVLLIHERGRGSIVPENIDPSMLPDYMFHQRPYLIVSGNISPHQKGCATFGADLIHSLLPAALVDVRHHYPCPARSESSSASPANSRGRPGNDGHSVLKDHSGR